MTRKQGATSEAFAVAYYTAMGYKVSLPQQECRYDILVDTGMEILRVQVKSTSYKRPRSKAYTAQLCTSGGNRSGTGKISYITVDECDVVFIMADSGQFWELPSKLCENKRSIGLTEELNEYKLKMTVSWAGGEPY